MVKSKMIKMLEMMDASWNVNFSVVEFSFTNAFRMEFHYYVHLLGNQLYEWDSLFSNAQCDFHLNGI